MRNCLVIDLDRCSGCDGCVAACKLENNVDLGVYYNRVHAVGPTGTFPDIEQYWIPLQCQQCENPGCIEVCPTGASYRDEATGVVLVNAEECIGCESCLKGCPYNVRTLNPNTNVVEKCTLCFQRHEEEAGCRPACTTAAAARATSATWTIPTAPLRRLLRRLARRTATSLTIRTGSNRRRSTSCPPQRRHGRAIL